MRSKPKSGKLIDLEASLSCALYRPLVRSAMRILGLDTINRMYAEFHGMLADRESDDAFFIKVLKFMQVQFSVGTEDFERIPKQGPLLVVSNHPYGGLDGIILGALLKSARPDTKLMGNYWLMRMDGIRGSIIPVNPFENAASRKMNLKGMRDAFGWLKSGACLGTFPAGEVSCFRIQSRAVVDRPWSPHIINLVRRTGASVLPVYFEGQNSLCFQLAGFLHPRLRTLLLAREFARMRGAELTLRIGQVIHPDRLLNFEQQGAAAEYLRLKTYSLKMPRQKKRPLQQLRFPFRSNSESRPHKPIVPAQAKRVIAEEIEQLSERHMLVEQGNYRVYIARAHEIPSTLKEIGRLREIAFRAVGEGTGQASDLDAYDRSYRHLFMWDRAEKAIVGAYRLGLVDELVAEYGVAGLYTSTLFHYKPGFLEQLGPAIELGRSFISLSYQKKYASLFLIWRGITRFVLQNPRYKTLFGPVSITDGYHSISKNLMVHFLRKHSFDNGLSAFVRAKKPAHARPVHKGISLKQIGDGLDSIDAVSAVISGFEADKKGIPVLLRHYLKLSGTLVSFNIDPAFSDVIDGLILVDLTKTDAKLLNRYMTPEGAAAFLAHHKKKETLKALV